MANSVIVPIFLDKACEQILESPCSLDLKPRVNSRFKESWERVQMLDKYQGLKAVFVHLGEKLPEHLILNLNRHIHLFPNIEVVLIVDRPPTAQLDEQIEVFEYKRSLNVAELFNIASSHMDHNFRQGFWVHTFERFFAIEHFHESNPSTKLLHVESDVILMPNFPWAEFDDINKMAWLNVNEQNDIAALVFLDSFTHTKKLADFLRDTLSINPKSTDMSSLREFARLHFESHMYLPSILDENKRAGFSCISLPGEVYPNSFDGIFDPLAMGIWFFGQDPKNAYGVVRRYIDQTHHFVDARGIQISYNAGRLYDQKGRNIYSLHIHSKNRKLFDSGWEVELSQRLKEARNHKNAKYIDFSALYFALSERTFAQHLWHYLSRKTQLYNFVHTDGVKSFTATFKRLLRI
jgi:hypothetical protein